MHTTLNKIYIYIYPYSNYYGFVINNKIDSRYVSDNLGELV